MATRTEKFGIFNFGFIENNRTFINELNELLEGTSNKADFRSFNISFYQAFKDGSLKYLDKFGEVTDEEKSNYALYHTGFKNSNDSEIIAYFHRFKPDKNWNGIYFGTENELIKEIKLNLKFRIGKMIFDDWNDGFQFLEELSQRTIPEKWSYRNHESPIPHPILKSYLENTFEKLLKDSEKDKLLIDDKNKYALFNTGLLDKFFHDIFIIVEIRIEDDEKTFWNPNLLKSLSDLTKRDFKFDGELLNHPDKLPDSIDFFSDIKEVTFNNSLPIDRSYDKFTHIIEERKDRFPDDYQNKDTTELARALDNSINYAKAMAKRNYKLIVPQYRPQLDKLQLLMPIYLSGSYTNQPDFALVLDLEDGIYTPETILPLDAAYQNARLIAKPDDFWLNPDDI
jgi:hypothetical protein